jgi:hypothetical protein
MYRLQRHNSIVVTSGKLERPLLSERHTAAERALGARGFAV